jgi:hypothetical protein
MHFVISGTWGPTDPTRAEREACARPISRAKRMRAGAWFRATKYTGG